METSSDVSVVGHHGRILTEEEIEKLNLDKQTVSEFRQRKLENEASRNWDKFYKRNNVNFFKDRHWTKDEFQQICPDINWQGPLKILEAGCGVGNFLYPFFDSFPNAFVYACDFSSRAIDFVKENSDYNSNRCHVFVCDLTLEKSLHDHVPLESIDVCTFVFVLSAIHPEKMPSVLKNIHKVIKLDGCVIVRDYGLYDHAMLRFSKGHKLMENFYVRQDGTRAYYFSEEKLKELFEQAGFETVFCQYVHKETVNKKENICVPRVFIQGRFKKVI